MGEKLEKYLRRDLEAILIIPESLGRAEEAYRTTSERSGLPMDKDDFVIGYLIGEMCTQGRLQKERELEDKRLRWGGMRGF